ncbi:DUF2911 domain-containing protein [Hymenobacter jejuensis]|uniref:DUF2911 domain-containing protein n=1 Tax=Hymenobacter jejuensis TaxID=2502781 RepID=A0A5B8A5P8_9BACT|nr:DUF2911 domain-containing protein [Hymenobacter jejuensis]QDA62003.1 DUF2911 domain-containing protein [Hymenobacter jejuensis]
MRTYHFVGLFLGFQCLLAGNGALAQGSETPAAGVPAATTTATPPQLPLPQVSPHAVLTQTIGLTEVGIDYHAPGVKNRPVWGQLVPYEQVWRAGANENTVISFSQPITLNGKAVPAGRYSFYVIPHADKDWEIILNRVTTHWGNEGYDAKDDQLRVAAMPEPAPFHETLLYWFSEVQPTGAHLNLTWEKRTLTLLIETQVHNQVLAGIEKTLSAKPDDWQLLAQAADYLVQNNLQAELALRYINESIKLNDTYANNWIKARLLAAQQDFGTAVVYARKALKLGDKDDASFKAQQPNMRIALTEWQSKAY